MFDKPKILYLVTEDWAFCNHRMPVARAARDMGFEVFVATRYLNHKDSIEREGFNPVPIKLIRSSLNICKELTALLDIIKIYNRIKPDIVHHVALKPNIYGSFAAMLTGVPSVVNAVIGRGHIINYISYKKHIIRFLIEMAYRIAFIKKNAVGIFQNPEDLEHFVQSKILQKEKSILIRSSGVDISKYAYRPEANETPIVMLATRMLWSKGVGDFVEAAKLLHEKKIDCRFVLVGSPDDENPSSIGVDILNNWHRKNIVEWWGYSTEMPKILSLSHIVVLPTTYGEGVPKILLEAASCGRAIIANDVPGCREIVRHNINGLLVQPNDWESLANAIEQLLINSNLRKTMGLRGREIVVNEFAQEIVMSRTATIYKELLTRCLF